MPTYSFIKITNNDNTSDFMLDVTSMHNYRSRVSALRTQCLRHLDCDVGKDRQIYKYFFLDYSFYRVHRQEFPNLAAARVFRNQLEQKLLMDRQNKWL